MKNYISRPLYIKRIEPFIDKSIIKVITGQRRIGKSYILLQISDIIYGAQNETYIEDWEKKVSNLLIYKRLCKI